MKQIIVGFAIAALIGAGALYAQSVGMISFFNPPAEDTEKVVSTETDEDKPRARRRKKGKKRRRKGRRGRARLTKRKAKTRAKNRSKPRAKARSKPRAKPAHNTGSGTSGDSLGSPGARRVNISRRGGEKQLSAAAIERGIDSVWRGVERCLVLIPSNAPAEGKVVAGMNIASNGRVTKVNLRGPNVIIQGEAGSCIRKTLKSINYPGFNGPDMLVSYPMYFD